jgi:hypothetical protein
MKMTNFRGIMLYSIVEVDHLRLTTAWRKAGQLYFVLM